MFWFDNEFCFKNEYIQIFGGTLVGKRQQTIFKKCWFDIASLLTIYKCLFNSSLCYLGHVLLGVFVLQLSLLPSDVSVSTTPVLPLDKCVLQQPALAPGVSVCVAPV
jgi:hypothetical protein